MQASKEKEETAAAAPAQVIEFGAVAKRPDAVVEFKIPAPAAVTENATKKKKVETSGADWYHAIDFAGNELTRTKAVSGAWFFTDW